MTPTQRAAILTEVKGGNKIAAIKLCREATGMGLAEAKDVVEQLEAGLSAQHPEKFTRLMLQKSGCTGVLALLALLVVVVVWIRS